MKKILNWILIIFAAILVVVVSIFGSAIYYTIFAIGRGLGVVIVMGIVIWFAIKINKNK